MMKTWYVIIFLGALLSMGCQKMERGQYPIDSDAPGKVTLTGIENLPGGAVITYEIPSDEDLLYVKAVYRLDNGELVEQKASAYTNKLKVEGIGRAKPLEVTLIAGDRSQNESEPVVVTANPLDAPVYEMLNSLKAYDDFGGIRLEWDNPQAADVVLSVLTNDDNGDFVTIENFYTNSKTGKGAIRGYESAERVFGMTLRDRWGNRTDTIKDVFVPLYEEEIKGSFARWNPPGIPYTQYAATYAIEMLWDGLITTFYLQQTKAYPHSFTFDIGKVAKLSRIHQTQRQGATLIYTSQNVHRFELWGSTTPNVSDDFSGWSKIGEFIATKPSGQPAGQNTAEDQAFAVSGETFLIDPSAPPVRYIRYVINNTWSGDANAAIADLKFFGSVVR